MRTRRLAGFCWGQNGDKLTPLTRLQLCISSGVHSARPACCHLSGDYDIKCYRVAAAASLRRFQRSVRAETDAATAAAEVFMCDIKGRNLKFDHHAFYTRFWLDLDYHNWVKDNLIFRMIHFLCRILSTSHKKSLFGWPLEVAFLDMNPLSVHEEGQCDGFGKIRQNIGTPPGGSLYLISPSHSMLEDGK